MWLFPASFHLASFFCANDAHLSASLTAASPSSRATLLLLEYMGLHPPGLSATEVVLMAVELLQLRKLPSSSLHVTSLLELISSQRRCWDGLQPCTAAAAGHSPGGVLVSNLWVVELGVSWFIASLVNLCLPGFTDRSSETELWAAEVAAQVHADQQEDSCYFQWK